MRSVAESKGIVCLDALWVFDSMLDAGILSSSQALVAFEAMRDDPRCPVPKPELIARIQSLDVWIVATTYCMMRQLRADP